MNLGKIRRFIIMVLDGAGCGVMPQHPEEDEGANTIGNVAWWYLMETGQPIPLPNLQRMGIGNLAHVPGVPPVDSPTAAYGKCSLNPMPMTDTNTGHWGITGLETGLFPSSRGDFPPEFLKFLQEKIKEKTGKEIEFLGDGKNISGTTILTFCGDEAKETGKPIIYTSSDSVVQIAWWIGYTVLPSGIDPSGLKKLNDNCMFFPEKVQAMNEFCQIVRQILNESPNPDHWYLRVISRPFVSNEQGGFTRVDALRKDYSLAVPGITVLDLVYQAGFTVGAVGKIYDMFSGKGITPEMVFPPLAEQRHSKDDAEGIEFTIQAMQQDWPGILFTNLVDFDANFGHRDDPNGYANNMIMFDRALPRIIVAMKPSDVLIITGDHGNDPTRARTKWYTEYCGPDPKIYKAKGTNHTREFVPLLLYGQQILPVNVRTKHLPDIAKSIACGFGLSQKRISGKNFLHEITA